MEGKHNIVLGRSWATHPRITGRKNLACLSLFPRLSLFFHHSQMAGWLTSESISWWQLNYNFTWVTARPIRGLPSLSSADMIALCSRGDQALCQEPQTSHVSEVVKRIDVAFCFYLYRLDQANHCRKANLCTTYGGRREGCQSISN